LGNCREAADALLSKILVFLNTKSSMKKELPKEVKTEHATRQRIVYETLFFEEDMCVCWLLLMS